MDRIDHYVQRAAGSAGPEAQEEIRSHLLELVEAYMELGDSEEEAVRSALAQFGKPEEIASEFSQGGVQASPFTWKSLARELPFSLALYWASLVPLVATLAVAPSVRPALAAWAPASWVAAAEVLTVVVFLLILPAVLQAWLIRKRGLSQGFLRSLAGGLAALIPVMLEARLRPVEPLSYEVMGSNILVLVLIWSGLTSLFTWGMARRCTRQRPSGRALLR